MNIQQMLLNMIKQGMNPQQILMQMMSNGAGRNNPILNNIFSLAKSNNYNEIERIARNLAKERGIDFDKEFNKFRNQLGI